MFNVAQSVALLVVFKAYLASDHITPATGKTIAITISKNGGAFANPSAGATNATEIANGWYKVTLSTTDTATVGPLAIHGAEGTIDAVAQLYNVMTAHSGLIDVNAQLAGGSAIETAATIATATVTAMDSSSADLNTLITGQSTIISAIAIVQADTDNLQTRIPAALVSGRMDASVGAMATDVVTAAAIANGAIDAATFAAGAINAAAIAADAITDAKVAADVTIASVTGAVGSVTGSVGSVTGAVGSVTGNIGGNLLGTLSTTERDAIADAHLDRANSIETGITPRLAHRYGVAAAVGVVSGAGTAAITIKGANVATTRIVTAGSDVDGNRPTVTLS